MFRINYWNKVASFEKKIMILILQVNDIVILWATYIRREKCEKSIEYVEFFFVFYFFGSTSGLVVRSLNNIHKVLNLNFITINVLKKKKSWINSHT